MGKHYEDIGFAKVDHHRHQRKGFPEVIYCEGKTPAQVAKIAQTIWAQGHNVLATRADRKAFLAVKKVLKKAEYHETARIISVNQRTEELKNQRTNVAIITAGTADLPVAEEAAVTAEFLGLKVDRIFDVGVAGIHRLIKNLPRVRASKVVVVVAGMEGALPSVVGGLIDKPIIAVPTSIGYGASFKGLSALLTMMNSCSPGIAVVNIDNGFGAAVMAYYIVK
jgi:pyridinium-3,5-biscarboxylic acid mononucleotide synthase